MNQETKVCEMNLTEVERSFTSWETDILSLIYAMDFLGLLFYSLTFFPKAISTLMEQGYNMLH